MNRLVNASFLPFLGLFSDYFGSKKGGCHKIKRSFEQ